MRCLPDLQRRFAAAIAAPDGIEDAGLAVYRNAVRANYRNALRASYPVVCALTGTPFFHAAVDAFAAAHPSRSGDLARRPPRGSGAAARRRPAARSVPGHRR